MTNPSGPLLLDASCLLNLYATGRLREIALTLPYQVGVADYVLEVEALYTVVPDPGGIGEQREPVNISSLLQEGTIEVMRLEQPEEQETFVDFAALLDDGEAITAAIAQHRGGLVATDDRKAIRVLRGQVPPIPIASTLELLHLWAQEGMVTDVELQEAVEAMRLGASYVPSIRDPLYAWWLAISHGGSAGS